jgi:hypothetical protein
MAIQLWLVTVLLYILLRVLLDVLQAQPAAAIGIVAAAKAAGHVTIAAVVIVSVMDLVLD